MSEAANDQVNRSTVNITALSVTLARAGRLFALTSVEIDIGGVVIELHGIRALRVGTEGTPDRATAIPRRGWAPRGSCPR